MRKKRSKDVFVLMSAVLLVNAMWLWTLAGEHRDGDDRVPYERDRVDQKQIFSSLEAAVAGAPETQILVFFSLACHVCWDELFEMKEFVEKYSIPVGLVGIAKDSANELQSFAARYSFAYPIVLDEHRQLYRKFKVKIEPYRVILEKGKVIYQDDLDEDFLARREKAKRCLLEIGSR